MRDRDRDAGGQQQQRVHQRDAPGRHDAEGTADVRRTVGRPGRGETAPQELVGQRAAAFATQNRDGEHARVEQRAEECAEEHHFGEDEPHHSHAERHVHLAVEGAAQGFVDDRAEPADHHADDGQRADRDDHVTGPDIAIEPIGRANHEQEQADRGDDGPAAAVRNVIGAWLRHVPVPVLR